MLANRNRVLPLFLLPVLCGCQTTSQTYPNPSRAPAIKSFSPTSGSGSAQTFKIVVSAAEGNSIATARLLLNTAKDGRKACYVYYQAESKQFLLVNDAGDGSHVLKPGDASVRNGQCILRAAGSSAAVDGSTATLQLDLAFEPTFAGPKIVFGFAEDNAGRSTDLVEVGTWTVVR
jgi:hypothetical protein